MWKASAINANDPTHKPTPNSTMKNTASINSMTRMRVDFDHAIFEGFQECELFLSVCVSVCLSVSWPVCRCEKKRREKRVGEFIEVFVIDRTA